MIIKRDIKLSNTLYYIYINCEYKQKDNYTHLCIKDYKDDYYDGGDLSLLIEELEKKYDSKKLLKRYNTNIGLLSDALYIYEHIPFISGVGDCYYRIDDNTITSESFILKEELDKYIKDNNIKLAVNSDFILGNQFTWKINI